MGTVMWRSLLVMLWLGGCSGTPHEPTIAPPASAGRAPAAAKQPAPRPPDPDLHRPPPVQRLAIDWASVALASDADATALWLRIAPTGADWEDKLPEIPPAIAHELAVALLRGGNFTCAVPPSGACARPLYDVAPPADTAGLSDPCLRRLLALWSIDLLADDDLPAVRPSLLAIAAIPPPESQLVAAAIRAIPDADQDTRLELLGAAWRAGQHDLVDSSVGSLDEAHLAVAVKRHHIAGALEVLSPEASRAVYLAAITDPALPARARTMAITELAALAAVDTKLAPELQTALVAAVASKDCAVAAAAVRVLDQHGDHRFVPSRPRTTSTAQLMRAVCVLASYEALQGSDEVSLLATYLPARGLERTTITYDPLSEVDSDGDGDPHTNRSGEIVPRNEAVLPELDDLVRAMQHCTGTVCVSEDHEFRFVWKPISNALMLARIELAERPPCVTPTTRTP
jgi:hypothetical protein